MPLPTRDSGSIGEKAAQFKVGRAVPSAPFHAIPVMLAGVEASSVQSLVPSVPLVQLAQSAPPQAPSVPAWKLRLFQHADRLAQLKRADR